MKTSFFKVSGGTEEYDAFVSYSHNPDERLAAAIQTQLERFVRRWYRPRAMRVFRDQTDLPASPGLWQEVERRLEKSRWFILVASPDSSKSPWVQREIVWWLNHHRTNRFIIALASGTIVWKSGYSPDAGDFDWTVTDALPDVLRGAFTNEPLWVDLRSLPGVTPQEDAGNVPPQLGDLVAQFAAPMLGRDMDQLIGERAKYTKRTRRLTRSIIATLSALLLLVSAAAIYAINQRDKAITQARIATARLLAADSGSLLNTNLAIGQLLAVEAYHMDRNPQTTAALFTAATYSPSLVRYLPAGGAVSAIGDSANGRVAIVGTEAGQVRRWQVSGGTGARIAQLRGAVMAIASSTDGGVIAATSPSEAAVWASRHGTQQIPLPRGDVTAAVTVSPNGRYVVVASYSRAVAGGTATGQAVITLLDRFTGRLRRTQVSLPPFAMGAPDNSAVVLASQGGPWERLSLPALTPAPGPATVSTGVHGVAFALSSNGRFFAYTNGGSTMIWSTASPDPSGNPELLAFTHGSDPQSLAVSPDGKRVAVGDGGTIYTYATAHGGPTQLDQHVLSGNSSTPQVRFLGDDNHLISASGNSLALWNLNQFSRIGSQTQVAVSMACSGCGPPVVEPSPDGQNVAILGGNPTAIVLHSLSPKKSHQAADGIINNSYGLFGWNSNGSDVFILHNGSLEAVPVNGKPVTFRRPVSNAEYPVTVLPSRGQLIETNSSGGIRIVSLARGTVERSIAQPGHLPAAEVTSPDGSYVAERFLPSRSSTTYSAEIIDLSSGQAHTVGSGDVTTVTFSGGHLLIQRANGNMEIWDMAGTVLQRVIHQDPSYLPTGGSVITTPVLAGSLLVQERSNGALVVTEIDSGSVIGSLPRSSLLKTGLAVDPRGDKLVSVTEAPPSGAGELAQWSLSSNDWIRAACAVAGRGLTAGDMRRFTGTGSPGFLACSG
jgi:WD40 repeat protein